MELLRGEDLARGCGVKGRCPGRSSAGSPTRSSRRSRSLLGQLRTITITDRARLAQLAGRAHVLRLEVPAGPHANGLCVYGAPTGHGEQPAPADTQPITLTFAR